MQEKNKMIETIEQKIDRPYLEMNKRRQWKKRKGLRTVIEENDGL